MSIDVAQLLERIAQLEHLCAQQARLLETQAATIEKQARQIEHLEARLAKDSRTSSKPPSSDTPRQRKQRTKKPRSLRKQGAQPGHAPTSRKKLEPDEIRHLRPERCGKCDHLLAGDDPEALVHQVVELPPIRPHVIDFHLHQLPCPTCAKVTRAALPKEYQGRTYGPRITATAANLTGQFHLSKRRAVVLLRDMFGVRVSTGTLSAMEARASIALKGAWDEAIEQVRRSPVAYLDETPWWRTGGQRGQMWVAVGERATVLRIDPSRSKNALEELIGPDYSGTMISDRYSAYTHYASASHQWCLAHLLRDFEALGQKKGRLGKSGRLLAGALRWMFRVERWDRRQEEGWVAPEDRSKWQRKVAGAIETVLVDLGQEPGAPSWSRTLMERPEELWRWLEDPQVEGTNNKAERALRPSVIWRKSCFGTESERGERFVERMATVCQTLRRQGRGVFDFVLSSLLAHQAQRPAPKLLPA